MAKKPRPYKPPTPKAKPKAPVPQNSWQCMWGCGYSAGNMNTVRSHESGCSKKPK